MRGGNATPYTRPRASSGSSPLARGKLTTAEKESRRDRIIPACAGETQYYSRRVPQFWDHPRLRGGNLNAAASASTSMGSSPLARGKLGGVEHESEHARIIPACAGETRARTRACAISRDHPRLRGGNGRKTKGRVAPAGSSPLARGKLLDAVDETLDEGIIPACAGETATACGSSTGAWDHPRLRGGNGRGPRQPNSRAGSSPLARGKPEMYRDTLRGIRIIPACAGETNQMLALPCQRPDHPRLRGGNASVSSIYFRMAGSSPLARGKQGPPLSGTANSRIIPACAGETGSKSSPE